jgi:hypothetical protein
MSQELLIAATALTGLLVIAGAMLKGWQDWLALKTRELESVRGTRTDEGRLPESMARIEIADLKERIRKLEAIASGVDI